MTEPTPIANAVAKLHEAARLCESWASWAKIYDPNDQHDLIEAMMEKARSYTAAACALAEAAKGKTP